MIFVVHVKWQAASRFSRSCNYFANNATFADVVVINDHLRCAGDSKKAIVWISLALLGHKAASQGLSQELETGCLKLAIVKYLGVQIFKGNHNI